MAVGILERIRSGGLKTRLAVILGALVALVVFAILVDTALSYNRVHAGITISGADVGRMTPDDTESALAQRVQRAANNQVTLVADGGRTWHVLPADVGTEVNTAETVAAAMAVTRDGSVFHDLGTRFSLYFSKKDVPLQVTADPALLDALLGEIASELDVPPVNAGLAIDGNEVSVIEGRDGLVVDTDTARAAVEELLFRLASGQVPIAMKAEAPAIKATDTSEAVAMAKTMLSEAVRLQRGDLAWT